MTVDLYAFDWRKGHAKIESKKTDASGRVWFAPSARSGSYFLLARKGRDIAFDADYLYLQGRTEPRETRSTLIYTDRSIYRPGQKLFWKVLAYKGRPDLGRISPDAGATVSVWLEDINNQRVAQATAAANAFGTASGEFTIPATGRPLGEWQLRSLLPTVRRRCGRGIQAADIRSLDQGPGEAAAAQPARRAQRRGPILLRPPGHGRRGRLAGQARAALPALVVVG